jgi:hypothetical protein
MTILLSAERISSIEISSLSGSAIHVDAAANVLETLFSIALLFICVLEAVLSAYC